MWAGTTKVDAARNLADSHESQVPTGNAGSVANPNIIDIIRHHMLILDLFRRSQADRAKDCNIKIDVNIAELLLHDFRTRFTQPRRESPQNARPRAVRKTRSAFEESLKKTGSNMARPPPLCE